MAGVVARRRLCCCTKAVRYPQPAVLLTGFMAAMLEPWVVSSSMRDKLKSCGGRRGRGGGTVCENHDGSPALWRTEQTRRATGMPCNRPVPLSGWSFASQKAPLPPLQLLPASMAAATPPAASDAAPSSAAGLTVTCKEGRGMTRLWSVLVSAMHTGGELHTGTHLPPMHPAPCPSIGQAPRDEATLDTL